MSREARLVSGDASAGVSTRGAEPTAWSIGQTDLLWSGDRRYWGRTCPILFPIVGRANGGTIRVGAQAHEIGVHGFAAESDFEVVAQSADRLRMVLVDDAGTRSRFPFSFRLEVCYWLQPSSLLARFAVANPGDRALPYALGFHPGLRWPFAGGGRHDYGIVFDDDEDPSVPVITSNGLFSLQRRPVPLEGRRLALSEALMADEALCFLDARSRSLDFVAPDGAVIAMAADNFAHFALWSRPPAAFLCLEAWTGHGDPEGFDGDIFAKPSMRRLEPGHQARHTVELTFHPSRKPSPCRQP